MTEGARRALDEQRGMDRSPETISINNEAPFIERPEDLEELIRIASRRRA